MINSSMLRKTLAGTAVAAATATTLFASPAQATVPRPQPVQNTVERTVNLRAGEGCAFPVRINVRIDDLDRDRRGNRLVVDADGVRGRVTNLRNGDVFRFRGDTRYRINLRTDVIRGDGAQLLLLDRRRGRDRLVFTEDRTRGDLLGGRIPVLPRERLISVDGDFVNVCRQIR